MDPNVKDVADGIAVLSSTGENGFIVTALLSLFAMLVFMGWTSTKDRKTVNDLHKETRRQMEDLRDRVVKSEKDEEDCLLKLDDVSRRLETSIVELNIYKRGYDV